MTKPKKPPKVIIPEAPKSETAGFVPSGAILLSPTAYAAHVEARTPTLCLVCGNPKLIVCAACGN